MKYKNKSMKQPSFLKKLKQKTPHNIGNILLKSLIATMLVFLCSIEANATTEQSPQSACFLNLHTTQFMRSDVEDSKTMSKSTSHFPNDETQANRIFNIKKIAETLNNTVLQPNEVFSFQKLYDISHKDEKFKPALGIANKQLSNNVYAGGICQVATVLFRAAVSAEFAIIEHHNHSITPFYGLNKTDAMFNDKTADLKIKNIKGFPVKIAANVKDDYIEIKILQC